MNQKDTFLLLVTNILTEKEKEKRRRVFESQLKDSKYGIAYIDSTEHVIQLNNQQEFNQPNKR